MFVPLIVWSPMRIEKTEGFCAFARSRFAIPVIFTLSIVGTLIPPRSFTVVTVKGSVVGTRFVMLNASVRPKGPGTGRFVNISGRDDRQISSVHSTVVINNNRVGRAGSGAADKCRYDKDDLRLTRRS